MMTPTASSKEGEVAMEVATCQLATDAKRRRTSAIAPVGHGSAATAVTATTIAITATTNSAPIGSSSDGGSPCSIKSTALGPLLALLSPGRSGLAESVDPSPAAMCSSINSTGPDTCGCETPNHQDTLFCDGCDEAFPLCCTGLAGVPQGDDEWLCAGCSSGGSSSSTPEQQPDGRDPDQGHYRLECVVCLHKPRSVLLRPCNHLVLCGTCAEPYGQAAGPMDCPICRVAVESTHTVHAAGQACRGKGCDQEAACSVVLRPCNHMCLCTGCADDLFDALPLVPKAGEGGKAVCPVCTEDVGGSWSNVVLS